MVRASIALVILVASSAGAEVGSCGAIRMDPPLGECFQAAGDSVSVTVTRAGLLLLHYEGEKPGDGYYSLVTGPDDHVGFYFSPSSCDWRVVVGDHQRVLEQVTSHEAGQELRLPAGVQVEIRSSAPPAGAAGGGAATGTEVETGM